MEQEGNKKYSIYFFLEALSPPPPQQNIFMFSVVFTALGMGYTLH